MARVVVDTKEWTDDELIRMPRSEAVKGLTEPAQRFCEHYIICHNHKIALLKAGFSEASANAIGYGYKLLRDPRIRRYISWLKVRVLNEALVKAADIIDEWVRIAFSDITDFVEVKPYGIKLKPAEQMDGQLVKSIKMGRDGVSIELYDKLKALDNLARYCKDMPSDWKQKLEERRMQLLEQEFELKKKISDAGIVKEEDDNFVDALKQSAKVVWEDETK